MNNAGRFMTFLLVALGVWTLMHVYVLARLWSLPATPGPGWHRAVLVGGILLWLSFPLGQVLSRSLGRAAAPLEFVGAVWVGVLFLLLVTLLAADLVTGFGWLLPSRPARQVAAAVGLCLSAFGFVQGLRPPVVLRHTVPVRGLMPEHEGLRIVQLSDVHLGPFLRSRWLERRLTQVAALRPDLILITGDLLDQDASLSEALVPWLRQLQAPLGVWGVTGNHEFYAGLERSLAVFRDARIQVLRDRAQEIAPGLVLAGVDDLTARRQFGLSDHPVDRALTNRPPGTTIFLCHSPLEVERAAELRTDLMLSGHTHAGQIWPFRYLVRMMYPHVEGRYLVNGMTLIVSRGTGFWGPPMRLFKPAEITSITLTRAKDDTGDWLR
jgi:predicted MPP superfamily phosphohydrolase